VRRHRHHRTLFLLVQRGGPLSAVPAILAVGGRIDGRGRYSLAWRSVGVATTTRDGAGADWLYLVRSYADRCAESTGPLSRS
jgi:hypothetical protein